MNLVDSAGSITELSQDAKLSQKCVNDPGSIQKVRCRVKVWDFSKVLGKIVVLSPFEELCVEKDIVILETTEKWLKRRTFVDVCLYKPTGGDMVLEKGTEKGVLSDAVAAFQLPIGDVGGKKSHEVRMDDKAAGRFD